MIEVLNLQRDGNEQPQFFALTFRYPNMGEGYVSTTVHGAEGDIRAVLQNGGIPEVVINTLFTNAH